MQAVCRRVIVGLVRTLADNTRSFLINRAHLGTTMNNNMSLLLGWREWVELGDLGLPPIKAKIDTGARTSALHAFDVRAIQSNGVQRVEFKIHPQCRTDFVVTCVADVVDQRVVADSGGHKENRWVIACPITMGGQTWRIDITLTNRDDMRFRMLLGRTAMKDRIQVDPSRSYVLGRRRKKNTEVLT